MTPRKNSSDPPFLAQYRSIFQYPIRFQVCTDNKNHEVIEGCELPIINLHGLKSAREEERLACEQAVVKASSDWGFFQVLNHGISHQLLEKMGKEQRKFFEMSFEEKVHTKLFNNSYRWGTPTATSLNQFSWSEAFHVPIAKISEDNCCNEEFTSLRNVMEKLAGALSELAHTLAGILVENLGHPRLSFAESCNESTCFLRLNRYPPCPFSPETFGLMPHTDSDFLTILYQDQVGGLQLMNDPKWVAVKPNPDALIVNIGDLFQAWSNDTYKSVEHKVITNDKEERYSIAYFLCPSYDANIGSCKQPSLYKNFTFGEFKRQVQEDVKITGQKVGLTRFLRSF